ncbi:MAG: nucleoside deaminase [Verrucomicrobia bacterium]|nr:nucleoside deaminase [Verrucomicrobiota bacterium]
MNEAFMREAIALSIDKMEAGEGGPFGAVVVNNGTIVGRGWNCVTSANDPTAHAEIMAIRNACTALGTFDLSGCELYASCEPCPMCLAAIYWARLDKLTFAAGREDAAAAGFDDELIYTEISKPWKNRRLPAEQMMQTEAQKAFQLWVKRESRIIY